MNGEGYQSSPDADIEVDKDIKENTSTLLQQQTSETQKDGVFIKSKKHKLKVMCQITLFVVMVLGAVLGIKLPEGGTYIHLKRSSDVVKVQYIGKAPPTNVQYSRITYSEEDIFNKYSTSIFKGKVLDIQNIKIIFVNADSEFYQAIVTVRIDEMFRGDEKAGDIVKIRIESPIGILADKWIEDRQEFYAMRVGAEGVFMATKYDETDYWEEVNDRLYLKDISDYGLMSEEYAIIENGNGYFFRGNSPILWYDTFDDVKKYVLEMIKPNSIANP